METNIDFYTVFSEKRPVRLSDETRKFAYESLHGKYGDNALETQFVALDDIAEITEMNDQQKYDAAIKRICEQAPVRICAHETVSGSATLGGAIWHIVPATIGGEPIQASISHLTIDFFTPLFRGVNYMEQQIKNKLKNLQKTFVNGSQVAILNGMLNAIQAMRHLHTRYMSALEKQKPDNYTNLARVPFEPATNFREAVQSLWFVFSFVRLCGNWPGIGRLDVLLGDFLKKDLASGAITIDEAREFLAGFFIKGCEWIQSDTPCGSGDAQHYQNIVLAGVGEDGREVTNEVTYLVLDIVEELGISDFPITVRVNENSPDHLLTRVAEVMRHGGGVIAIYNEPLILRSLTAYGYDETEARQFANDGCWEVQIPGKTFFTYVPVDSLEILLKDTLHIDNTDVTDDNPKNSVGNSSFNAFNTFEELYDEFANKLAERVNSICRGSLENNLFGVPGSDWQWREHMPTSVIDVFEKGCVENARSYLSGGPKYNLISPHIGGAPDVGNSLYAIDKLVFQEQRVSLPELLTILHNNWEDNELLRQYAANRLTYYGNDSDEADAYTVRVLNDFAQMVSKCDVCDFESAPLRFPAGVSTFGRQIEWREHRNATPFGAKAGSILSGNASPTPDTDFEGATAVIRSYCKADHVNQTSGSALDVKLLPSSVDGENGLEALKSLIKGFIKLGGYFMQIDLVDAEVLKQAQQHPESFKTLSVRVSGWNARFVTLDRDWQQMIIERSTQCISK